MSRKQAFSGDQDTVSVKERKLTRWKEYVRADCLRRSLLSSIRKHNPMRCSGDHARHRIRNQSGLIPELGGASGSRTPNLDVRLGVGALLFDLRQRRFIPP